MKQTVLGVAVAMALSGGVNAATPTVEELYELIKAQQAEIEALKSKAGEQDRRIAITDMKVEATAEVVETTATTESGWTGKTKIGGYGEHHFNHIDDKADIVDAHRYVLYVSHEFRDDLRMFSELEVEHGLAGADTNAQQAPGEVELEQAYIEWDYTANQRVKFGQFLVPVGYLNETHEPDTFYGTERNDVEKNILPTTWWETGVMFSGEIALGLSYDAGVHSGLATDEGGKVRSGRQKSAKAIAEKLAYTGRVRYTGIAGLDLAATVQFQDDITQGFSDVRNRMVDTDGDNSAVLLQAQARYQMDDLTLTALIAQWDIDGDSFEDEGTDKQSGWFLEASYKVTPSVGLFVRQLAHDNNAGNNDDTETERTDIGVNYWLHPNVVLKADWGFEEKAGVDTDHFNLGVGWSF